MKRHGSRQFRATSLCRGRDNVRFQRQFCKESAEFYIFQRRLYGETKRHDEMKSANNDRPFAITMVKSEGAGKNLETVLRSCKRFNPNSSGNMPYKMQTESCRLIRPFRRNRRTFVEKELIISLFFSNDGMKNKIFPLKDYCLIDVEPALLCPMENLSLTTRSLLVSEVDRCSI